MIKKIAHIVEGKVVNVSLWDGVTPWQSSEQTVPIADDSPAGIGWDYDGKKFVDNRPVEEFDELIEA